MSNGFVATKVSSCCQLDVDDNRLAQPLCSGRITSLHRSYGLVRPCAPHGYARLVVVATWTSPLASERQVPAVPHESSDQTRASYTPVTAAFSDRTPKRRSFRVRTIARKLSFSASSASTIATRRAGSEGTSSGR